MQSVLYTDFWAKRILYTPRGYSNYNHATSATCCIKYTPIFKAELPGYRIYCLLYCYPRFALERFTKG